MIYKILIVDDEELERKAITFVAELNFSGQIKIYEAENGKMAVNIANEVHPDIVVMDIKMPVMNGIEAAKEIINLQPDFKIIMLTGFTYFNYAKECVSIGAMDFLVKPSTDAVIIDMLRKAMNSVDALQEIEKTAKLTEQKLKMIEPYIESELLSGIIFSDESEQVLLENLKRLNIEGNCFTAAILFPDAEYGKYCDIQNVAYECRAAVMQLQAPDMRVILCEHYGRIYLLMSVYESMPRSFYSEYLEQFLRLVTKEQNCTAGIGVSAKNGCASEIPLLFKQARKAYCKKNTLQFFSDRVISDSFFVDPYKAEQKLCSFLSEHRYTELLEQLDTVLTELLAHSKDARAQICEVLVMLNSTAAESIAVEPTYALYNKFQQMQDTEKIKQYGLHFVQDIIDRMIQKETESSNEWVQTAREIISSSYTGDIMLEDVAKRVNFSTYYFSRLFKQQFGLGFAYYLTNLRIQKAKSLLRQPGAVVKEVAFLVGYNESNYFTRVFKKETGITPSEYQKNVSTAK